MDRKTLLLLLILLSYAFLAGFSNSSNFFDTDQADFDAGDYNQTESTADGNIILSIESGTSYYVSGDFNSQIFDGGGDTNWQILNWSEAFNYGDDLGDNNCSSQQTDANMCGNVLLMHFNETAGATTFTDSSGESNNGSCSGDVCPTAGAAGQFNNSLDLDGDDDFVSVADSSSLDITDAITVEAWVKKEESSRIQSILSKGTYRLKINNDDRAYFAVSDGSETYANVGAVAGGTHTDSAAVYNGNLYISSHGNGYNKISVRRDGSWQTVGNFTGILVVFDGNLYAGNSDGNVYLYEDVNTWASIGQPNSSNTVVALAVYEENLYAVSSGNLYRYDGGASWSYMGNRGGYITVYKGNLYVAESNDIYRFDSPENFTQLGSGIVSDVVSLAVYKDELYAGSIWADGNVFVYAAGTDSWNVVGTVGANTRVYCITSYIGNMYGSGYVGYGVRRYYDNNGTFSSSLGGGLSIARTDFNGFFWESGYSNAYSATIGTGVGVYANSVIPEDEYTHIAATFDGTTAKIYINGNLDSVMETPSLSIGTNDRALLIGNSYGSTNDSGSYNSGEENFDGKIDEVAVYDRALSPNEILSRYKRGVGRLKLQARSCNDSACDGESFIGPDGTSSTYFDNGGYSYDLNMISDNRYFQYRAVFETDDVNSLKGTTPHLLDVNIGYLILEYPKFDIKTYKVGADTNRPRSFFGIGERVRIVADGNSSSAPLITITDSNGTAHVAAVAMSDITSGDYNSFSYTYDINGALGGYIVQVGDEIYRGAFYRVPVWQDRYTDADSNSFPASFDLNVSEPGLKERWFEVFDNAVDFNNLSAISAIRVLDFNGTNYLEIPSQIHSKTMSGNHVSSANLVFFASYSLSEDRNFFVSYALSDNNTIYDQDFNIIRDGFLFDFNNSYYRARVDVNQGGLISKIWSRLGSDTNLSGYSPMGYAPEFRIGPLTYNVSSLTNPEYDFDINGNLISKMRVGGTLSSIDYNLTYTFYSNKPYFLIDTNINAKLSETWSYLIDNCLFLKDGSFSNLGYCSNGVITTSELAVGDSSDSEDLGDLNYIGFYSETTKDALGDVFISKGSTMSLSTDIDFYDDASYDYFKRTVYSGAVSSSDSFYSRTARAAFIRWSEFSDLNRIFFELNNPLTFVTGATSSNDSVAPINNDINYTPQDTNDSVDINCYAAWGDDIRLSSIIINIIGSDLTISDSQAFTDTNGTASYNIDANLTNAGYIDCNFIAYDLAGNYTSSDVNIAVSDVTAPNITGIATSPDSNADIDPGTTITVDANIIEYSGLTQAILHTRDYNTATASWNDWNAIAMTQQSLSDYNYAYRAVFKTTSNFDSNWQYKIQATDAASNDVNSDTNSIYSYYDYTWTLSPSSFDTVSETLDTNKTVTVLTIENTGDYSLSFRLTSNWSDKGRIFYNNISEGISGYPFSIASGGTAIYTVKVTTSTTERTDALTVTVTPSTSGASPSSSACSGTVISYAGGPFMYIEITETTAGVAQGDTGKAYSTRVTNKGNMDANSVNLTWALPSGFSVASGSATTSASDLIVDASLDNNITADIDSETEAGTHSLTVTATCCNDANFTKTSSTSVVVSEQTSSPVVCGDGTCGGSENCSTCPADCGECPVTAGATSVSVVTTTITSSGSGNPFATKEQQSKLFQTSEYYELLRGKDDYFDIKIENPFDDGRLANLKINVIGLLSKYLRLEPTEIDEIKQGEFATVTIHITAPAYFSRGEHKLRFTIEGIYFQETEDRWGNKLIEKVLFTEEREELLIVRESTKEEAEAALSDIRKVILDMRSSGYNLTRVERLLRDAEELLEGKDYEETVLLLSQVTSQYDSAKSAEQKIAKLEEDMTQANFEGIDVSQTNRITTLATIAFKRGDFMRALARIADAELTYALETKGEFNLMVYVSNNWPTILLAMILLSIAAYLASLYARLLLTGNRITGLHRDAKMLLSLIAYTQKKCFVENKLSMSEYFDTISHFETRLAENTEKVIEQESLKANLLKFRTKSSRLMQERERLSDMLKETQEDYFNKATLDSRVYGTRTKSLMARLATVEKDIVFQDALRALRTQTSKLAPMWNTVYRVIK